MSLAPTPRLPQLRPPLTQPLRLGYFLIYSKTQAKDFLGVPEEALGHGIFSGCTHDSDGHFTHTVKEANITAMKPGGEMLYSVEKIPLVCRGLQGYITARYGAGPGT